MDLANYNNMNYIAASLLKKGWHKNAIIGALTCASQESGFDPKINEANMAGNGFNAYPGAPWGWGLWQWSYLPNNKAIHDYAKSHSVNECLDFEINMMIKNNPAQWQSWNAGYSLNDYAHNKKGMSGYDCAHAWMRYWEGQPESVWGQYSDDYNSVMKHLNWSASNGGNNSSGTGSYTDGNNQPGNKPVKDPCGSNDDKNHNTHRPSTPNDTKPNDPPKGVGDKSKLTAFFNRLAAIPCIYSMTYRAQIITTGRYSDCSAFVSCAVETWLGLKLNPYFNTETLHTQLGKWGYKQILNSSGSKLPAMQTGDVIIMGAKGTSIGANGHTIIMEDSVNSLEMHGPVGSAGMRRAKAQWVVSIDHQYWGSNNWRLYVYRKS